MTRRVVRAVVVVLGLVSAGGCLDCARGFSEGFVGGFCKSYMQSFVDSCVASCSARGPAPDDCRPHCWKALEDSTIYRTCAPALAQ